MKILTSAEQSKLARNGTVGGWFDRLAEMFVDMGKLPEPGSSDDYYLKDLYASAGENTSGAASGKAAR